MKDSAQHNNKMNLYIQFLYNLHAIPKRHPMTSKLNISFFHKRHRQYLHKK
mgnify:CR=1 FL=1